MPQLFNDKYRRIVYVLLALLTSTSVVVASAAATHMQRAEAAALYFLAIGQGDSELIELPGGIQILIDGGPSGPALLNQLSKILSPLDRYIDLVIMTHPESDHFTGFIDLLQQYEVGAFIGNLRRRTTPAYLELHRQLVEHNVPYVQLVAGDLITIGDTKLRLLNPQPHNLVSKELNDTSLVVLLDDPSVRALYTGDISSDIEVELMHRYKIDVDVLKVGHHGSRFSSGNDFLKMLSPAVAVIEVGKNNYGHPTKQAIQRLTAAGSQVLRTDQQGIIKIIPQSGKLAVFQLK